MKKHLSVIAVVVLAMNAAAWAADLNVDCSSGTPGAYTSINAALAALPSHHGPHTITVSGLCKENVYLDGWTHLTIQSAPGVMATIQSPKTSLHVVEVWNSNRIVLQRLTITGGARGINVMGSHVLVVSSKIDGNKQPGAWVSGQAWLWVMGTDTEPASLSNNQAGATVLDTSLLWISDYANIDNNANRGIFARPGSQVDIFREKYPVAQVTINGNGWKTGLPGMEVTSGKVDLNGVTMTGNYGPAIIADYQSVVALSNSTLTGNAEGLKVLRSSLARIGASLSGSGLVTLVSNGALDLSCDTTALVTGDLSGAGTVDCKRIERELGPPRPGEVN